MSTCLLKIKYIKNTIKKTQLYRILNSEIKITKKAVDAF